MAKTREIRTAINDRAILVRLQLLRALCEWLGRPRPVIDDEHIWGRGFGFAFRGEHGGASVIGPAPLVAAFWADGARRIRDIERLAGHGWRFRRGSGPLAAQAREALWESGEFAMLRGPDDADLPALKKLGYAPEKPRATLEAITAREGDLSRILREEGTSAPLDDIVGARLWYWELGDLLPWAADRLGFEIDSLFAAGKHRLAAILTAMPTMTAEYALRRANWSNGDYTWTTNDIHDLGHLGVAVPYCDITWTEKHATHVLNVASVPAQFGTVVVDRPAAFVQALARLDLDS